jgi:hypothetical protein
MPKSARADLGCVSRNDNSVYSAAVTRAPSPG